jgi:hypothetical protein
LLLRIDCVGAHTDVALRVGRKNLGNIDILIVDASDPVKLRTRRAPDGRCGALFDSFEIAPFSNGSPGWNRTGFIFARETVGSQVLIRHMANEISDNTAGMNGESASVARLPAPIEFDRE